MTRDQILQKLLDERIIKEGDARDMRVVLPTDADESAVLAIIKGQYPAVKPRDVVNALGVELSLWSEAPSWTFEDFAKVEDKAEFVERWKAEQKRVTERGGTAQTRKDIQVEKDLQAELDQQWYLKKGYETAGDVSDQMRQEYERLKAMGVFSNEDMKAIEPFIHQWLDNTSGTTKEKIEEFITLVASRGVTSEELGGKMLKFRTGDLDQMSEEEQAFLDRRTGYQGLRSLSPEQQEAAGYGVDAVVDSSTDAMGSTFRERTGEYTGLGNEDILERERLDFTGEGWVLDRATGQRMTHSRWNQIKTNEEARAQYIATTSMSSVVERLLASGKFTQSSQYWDRDTPQFRNLMPVEDLAIPTLAPTGQPWEAETYDYKTGDGRAEWLGFSVRERAMRLKLMADNGIFTEGELDAMGYQYGSGGSALNFTAMGMWEQFLSVSSQFQYSPLDAVRAVGEEMAVQRAAITRQGSGRIAPTYSVPASLREIPDYKTLAQNTKSIFRGELGREMEDWEVSLYADELGRQHTTANERRIAIHKEAWDDAVSGGSTEVDFTAVEDPNLSLQYDIEDTYANEIDRNVRVEDRANQHRLLMSSISLGRRMV